MAREQYVPLVVISLRSTHSFGPPRPDLDFLFDHVKVMRFGTGAIVFIRQPGVRFGIGPRRTRHPGAARFAGAIPSISGRITLTVGAPSRFPGSTGREVSPRTSRRFCAASSSSFGRRNSSITQFGHGFVALPGFLLGEGQRKEKHRGIRLRWPLQLFVQSPDGFIADLVFQGEKVAIAFLR